MRILAKIHKRQRGDESAYQEMELFDTDRNPLEFPATPAAAAPTRVLWSGYTPSDTTVDPWTGTGDREIVIPWTALIGNNEIAELTADYRINLLQTGIYLVQFEGGFTVGYNGGTTEPDFGERGALIGYDETTAGGPTLSKFAAEAKYPQDAPITVPVSFNLMAPIIVHSAPMPILTAIYATAALSAGQNLIVMPDQLTYGWPNNPLQLRIVKLPGLTSGMAGE